MEPYRRAGGQKSILYVCPACGDDAGEQIAHSPHCHEGIARFAYIGASVRRCDNRVGALEHADGMISFDYPLCGGYAVGVYVCGSAGEKPRGLSCMRRENQVLPLCDWRALLFLRVPFGKDRQRIGVKHEIAVGAGQ